MMRVMTNTRDSREEVNKMAATTMTPTQVAEKLAGKEKAQKVAKAFVRPFLRKNYARKAEAKNTSWILTPAQVKAVTEAYKKSHKA